MPFLKQTVLNRLLLSLGIVTGLVAGMYTFAPQVLEDLPLPAWVLNRDRYKIPWQVLTEEDIAKGTTIQPNTHVIIHVPEISEPIAREVLFGKRGKRIRYWGYCYPENYDPEIQKKRATFPGKLFISEAERKARSEKEFRLLRRNYSIFDPPTEEDLRKDAEKPTSGKVRHEVEFFKAFSLCYIMTDNPLPVGTDEDKDGLNNKLEADYGTSTEDGDTDADGISDGVEVFNGTDALRRDTDGDGLIDGLEDEDWNGNVDTGETDPRLRDSDRDELCDGLCIFKLPDTGERLLIGEDENLNGQFDEGESDPLKQSTRNDGVTDFTAFFRCRSGEEEFCF